MFGADARAGDPDFCEPMISISFSSFLSSWKELAWGDQTPLTATRTWAWVCVHRHFMCTHTRLPSSKQAFAVDHAKVSNSGAPCLGLRA